MKFVHDQMLAAKYLVLVPGKARRGVRLELLPHPLVRIAYRYGLLPARWMEAVLFLAVA